MVAWYWPGVDCRSTLLTGLTGALLGGYLAAMSTWGVHQDHIKQYEQEVQQGRQLVVANGTPQQVTEAHNILGQTNMRQINMHVPDSANAEDITQTLI